MRFTLTYSGRLASRGTARVKHDIRCQLHPQLRELWRTHPALEGKGHYVTRHESAGASGGEMAARFLTTVDGYDFAVLVHPVFKLLAELDILLLRPEPPGSVVSRFGDIDNQLKTLFDALRRPAEVGEVPKSWRPKDAEEPLHCLLDDDKLITRVGVETDRLLDPDADENEVQATIRVTVKASALLHGNMGMIG